MRSPTASVTALSKGFVNDSADPGKRRREIDADLACVDGRLYRAERERRSS